MTKKLKKSKFTKIFSAIAVASGILLTSLFNSGATLFAYSEGVSVSNLNFNSSGDSYSSLETSPSGWTRGNTNYEGKSGVINVDNFNAESYALNSNNNPGKVAEDNRVLMLNSASSLDDNTARTQYYTNSNSISLSANSAYRFTAFVKVTATAYASIYIAGIENSGNKLTATNINYATAGNWQEYNFYVVTANKTQNVKFELCLGAQKNLVSQGAVFFDNLSVQQISIDEINLSVPKASILDLTDNISYTQNFVDIENSGFEEIAPNQFKNYKVIDSLLTDCYAEVLNLTTSNDMQERELGTYYNDVKLDGSKNNSNALVLYTKNDKSARFGVELKQHLNVNLYELYRISVNVKVANGATASVKLSEVLDETLAFPKVKEELGLNLGSSEIEISNISSDKFMNNWQTVSFYVMGRSLYNSTLKLEMFLGTTDAESSGIASFDNITCEKISFATYNEVSTGSFVKKLNLQETKTNSITNGTFNNVENAYGSEKYSIKPASWVNTSSNENYTDWGVVNTNTTSYPSTSGVTTTANPNNPVGFTDNENETNNILVLKNAQTEYQSIKSPSFEVETSSYYRIGFYYKALANNDALNVYILDNSNNVLFNKENIETINADWNYYEVLVKTYDYSDNLSIKIGFGNENNKATGYLFLDNFTITKDTTITLEDYKSQATMLPTLDFANGNFNLTADYGNDILTALRYTGNLESEVGSSITPSGRGGIIIAGDNAYEDIENENNQNVIKNIMVIETIKKAKYSMTAKDSLSLTSGNYYKFSVDVKTNLTNTQIDSEDTTKYGAIFGLVGLEEKITGIVADEWTTYTIYVNATNNADVNLYFALEAKDAEFAFFDNYKFETIDKETFGTETFALDENSNTLVINSIEKEENKEDDKKDNSDKSYIWLLVPSLIFGVAIILALVAGIMKKVKIKKWEKKKIASYDRATTSNRDAIRHDAEVARDAKISEVEQEIASINQRIAETNEVHKAELKAQRQSGSKGITKEMERKFKSYAKHISILEKQIDSLKERIEYYNTPEYLLLLQKQQIAEKVKKEKELNSKK